MRRVWLIAVTVVGCASSEWVKVRDTPRNPLAGTLDLVGARRPEADGTHDAAACAVTIWKRI